MIITISMFVYSSLTNWNSPRELAMQLSSTNVLTLRSSNLFFASGLQIYKQTKVSQFYNKNTFTTIDFREQN